MEFLGIYLAQETATALESFPLCALMCDLQAIASKIYDMQQAEGPAAVDLETDLDDSPKDLCKAFRLTARFCDYPSYPQTFLYNLHNLSTALDQVDCNDLEPN